MRNPHTATHSLNVDFDGTELALNEIAIGADVLFSMKIGDGPEIEMKVSDPDSRAFTFDRVCEFIEAVAMRGAQQSGRNSRKIEFPAPRAFQGTEEPRAWAGATIAE